MASHFFFQKNRSNEKRNSLHNNTHAKRGKGKRSIQSSAATTSYGLKRGGWRRRLFFQRWPGRKGDWSCWPWGWWRRWEWRRWWNSNRRRRRHCRGQRLRRWRKKSVPRKRRRRKRRWSRATWPPGRISNRIRCCPSSPPNQISISFFLSFLLSLSFFQRNRALVLGASKGEKEVDNGNDCVAPSLVVFLALLIVLYKPVIS